MAVHTFLSFYPHQYVEVMDTKVHTPKESVFGLLRSYAFVIAGLIVLTILSNGCSLVVPKIVAFAIDSYTA